MAIQLIVTFLILRQPHVHDFSLPFWIFEHRFAGSCLIGWHIFNHVGDFWCWRKLASWFWFFISTLRLPLILEMQEYFLAWFVSRSHWKTNFNHRRPWRSKNFHVLWLCQQLYKKLSFLPTSDLDSQLWDRFCTHNLSSHSNLFPKFVSPFPCQFKLVF